MEYRLTRVKENYPKHEKKTTKKPMKKDFWKKLGWKIFLTLLLIFFLWFYLQYKWHTITSIREQVFDTQIEETLGKTQKKP